MPNKLNALVCYNEYGNTGESDCDLEPAFPKGVLLIPHNGTFTANSTATDQAFQTAIQAGLALDSANSRYYWLGTVEDVNPTGESPVVESFGSGRKRQIRRGTVAYDFIMTGGIQKHREQFKFSGKHNQFDAVLVDEENTSWGRTTSDATPLFAGRYLSNLFVGDYMPTNGQKGGQWTVSIEFKDTNQVHKTFGYIKSDIDPFEDGTGLITYLINGTSASATTIFVAAKTNFGVDMHDLYATELAVVGAWIVKNKGTQGTITTSAVASTTGGWNITIPATGTDPDNPGSGGVVTVQGPAPSVLAGLNVIGFESNIASITLG